MTRAEMVKSESIIIGISKELSLNLLFDVQFINKTTQMMYMIATRIFYVVNVNQQYQKTLCI